MSIMTCMGIMIVVPAIFKFCTIPGEIFWERAIRGKGSIKVADYVSLAGLGIAIFLVVGLLSSL